MIDCCKGCIPPKRHPGCHSTCEEYLRQHKKHNQEREERYQMRKIDWDFEDYVVKDCAKNRTKRKVKFRKNYNED